MPLGKMPNTIGEKNYARDNFFLHEGISRCEQWLGLRWLQDLIRMQRFFFVDLIQPNGERN